MKLPRATRASSVSTVTAGISDWQPDQKPPEPKKDTIGCRHAHAYFAFVAPDKQCSSAGPTGGECATDTCESLCDLQAMACDSDKATCMAGCAMMSGRNNAYNIADGKAGKTEFSCRMLYTVRALKDDDKRDANCLISMGETPCPKPQ